MNMKVALQKNSPLNGKYEKEKIPWIAGEKDFSNSGL